MGVVGEKKHVTLEAVSKPHNDQGSRRLTVCVVASEDVCLPVLLSGRLSCCSLVRSNEETQGHYKPGHTLKSNLPKLLQGSDSCECLWRIACILGLVAEKDVLDYF